MIASYLPRSKITSERSKRRTVPLTISPTRSLNSVSSMAFSACRTFCIKRLLGVLRSDAAKALRRDFLFDLIAHFRVRLDPARIKNRNLVVLRNDLVRDDEFGERLDIAVSESISTRNSRAGPTAFLAACNNASWTAAMRISRLTPFSRSQNSRSG
jgi:hypothetical protein